MAHQMLATYRRLLSSTREVMTRRLPLHVRKAKLTNTRDKAAIADMVAKLDELQVIYSPHKVNGGAENPDRSLFAAEQADVLGSGQERECNNGSLRVEGRQVKARSCLPPYPVIDWDAISRTTVVRNRHGQFLGLHLPSPTNLPVLACDPGPNHPPNETYNPMGDKYTPPTDWDPFGLLEGFWTNLGPISFPRCPIKGYVWDRKNSWVLHAGHKSRGGSRGSKR